MGNAAGMIAQARRLLGTTEHPPGSNHNLVTKFFGFDGPWCNMSIAYEAAHSDNLPAVFGMFANTVAHAREFKRHGRWHYGLGGARPGDVVFFDFSGTRVIKNIEPRRADRGRALQPDDYHARRQHLQRLSPSRAQRGLCGRVWTPGLR